jgi:uncharacterized protein with GYD domain
VALFVIEAAYTPQAWAAFAKNPEDRRKAVSELAAKGGSTMRDLYFCFGEYDAMLIIEAPDAATAAAFAIAANMAGHLKAIKTTQLFSVDEAMAMMRKAGTMGAIRPPTG